MVRSLVHLTRIATPLLLALASGCPSGPPNAEPSAAEPLATQTEPETAAQTDWAARHQIAGQTPEDTAALWFEALFRYMAPETREDGDQGLQYLSLRLRGRPGWQQLPHMVVPNKRMTDPEFQNIFYSYIKGTSPENGYSFDRNNWELDILTSMKQEHGEEIVLTLNSSGSQTNRHLTLIRETSSQLYFVSHFTSLVAFLDPTYDPNHEER